MEKNVRISSHGVVYDLPNSPFVSERHCNVFRFSSARHKEKFDANVQKTEDWLCDSLSRRFHMDVDARILADFKLYYQVETRGYSVMLSDGEEVTCQEELGLSCLVSV